MTAAGGSLLLLFVTIVAVPDSELTARGKRLIWFALGSVGLGLSLNAIISATSELDLSGWAILTAVMVFHAIGVVSGIIELNRIVRRT